MEDELKLMYVHLVGETYKHDNIYQFIFSKDIFNIDEVDWGWDVIPALDNAIPPKIEYIEKVYEIKIKDMYLDVLHNSEMFSYIDGFDKIIALAWENIDDDDSIIFTEDVPRLVFHYGESYESVKSKLYARDTNMIEK